MKRTIFEEMGGTYTQVGDYFLPNLKLPEAEQKPIGVWGQQHLRYIREHKRGIYTSLLTSCTLNSYLADVDRQAQDMFLRLVEQMAKREGVTEELKVTDQMAWIGKMNSIQAARAVVNSELIYI